MSAEVRAALPNGWKPNFHGEQALASTDIVRTIARAFNAGQRAFECLARIPENTFRSSANRTSAGCWYSVRARAGNENFLRSVHRSKYPPRPVESGQPPST